MDDDIRDDYDDNHHDFRVPPLRRKEGFVRPAQRRASTGVSSSSHHPHRNNKKQLSSDSNMDHSYHGGRTLSHLNDQDDDDDTKRRSSAPVSQDVRQALMNKWSDALEMGSSSNHDGPSSVAATTERHQDTHKDPHGKRKLFGFSKKK